MDRIAVFVFCIINVFAVFGQQDVVIVLSKADTTYTTQDASLEEQENNSMIKVLWKDYFESKENRKEKRDCYARYTKLFIETLYGQITAPFCYVGYYLCRKKITNKLTELYKEKNLENIENIGKDITNGVIDKEEIKECLGNGYYKLWLYGDTDNPVEDGGVPQSYKSNLPMFIRRWFYSGVRNPRWNATYINNYSANIKKITTSIDKRTNTNTHNFGTSDTRLGTWLRWYVDEEGKWWFLYEDTKRTKENEGKLFYFGAVGLGNKEDGAYKNEVQKCRFEFSLNRKVKIDE